jgi:hypothetical protein
MIEKERVTHTKPIVINTYSHLTHRQAHKGAELTYPLVGGQ